MGYPRTYIASIIIAVLITGTFSVPQRANAIFGVGDTVFEIGSIDTVIQTMGDKIATGYASVSSFATAALQQKELVGDGVANAALNVVRNALVKSVLDWAKGGFNGKPAFVQNLNATLDAIADGVADSFIRGSGLSALCSPFALQVKGALALNYKNQRTGTQIQRCTFDTLGKNIKDFGKSVDRAKQMTFADFFTYTTNPVNSPQGAYLDAQAKLEVAITNKKGEKLKLLDFGKGFLSKEECMPIEGQDGEFNCQIITPGDTISASINKSLGLGQDALVSADEINEFVSAAISTAMQSVLTKGLAAYNSNSAPSGNYGYAQADIAYTSAAPAMINRILPTQQIAIDQLANAQTDIETTCYTRPTPVDQFNEPVVWTEEQYAADRLKQLQDKGVYDLLLKTIIKSGDAQRGYNELVKMLVRAQNATTSSESIAITQELLDLTDKPYIYVHNQESGMYLTDVQSQVSSKCSRFDFGGGGGGD